MPRLLETFPKKSWNFFRDFEVQYLLNGLVALLFATTGPLAVIMSVGMSGGLSNQQITSWIFGAFCINGLLSILSSALYKQPLGFLWTIPGTVLLGPALDRYDWPSIVGAFVLTGILIVVLGLTGAIRKLFSILPMQIVMGMVSGIFLAFGLDLIAAVIEGPLIGLTMTIAFLLWSLGTQKMKQLPPTMIALMAGLTIITVTGQFETSKIGSAWFADPHLQLPVWSTNAAVELVIPLTITVIVIQNGQGIGVLRSAGHNPPVNFITLGCGSWSLLVSYFGTVSTCLTGPATAILVSSGQRERQYVAGISFGMLSVGFGALAPLFSDIFFGLPQIFIATLAGLAMLPILHKSFKETFTGSASLGGFAAFLLTVSDISILNISAAFWGLVGGLIINGIENLFQHKQAKRHKAVTS